MTRRAQHGPAEHGPAGHGGWIELISGSMFSGKSEELIRRLRRAQIARQSVAIFKPRMDDRYSADEIVSHSQLRIPSTPVDTADEILRHAHEADVIGVDEAQFFTDDIVAVVKNLAEQGKRVVVAGLDKDFRGQPFGAIPQLMAEAEYVTKTLAICMRCGEPANFTQRLTQDNRQILIGETDIYEARCRSCFEPPED
ncbi:MAG: thymidine kinase [Candidatus Marinimicrobia bacterium]|nr:thymidine kinase [Candidatus Neomarinimicrobiota bacterium]